MRRCCLLLSLFFTVQLDVGMTAGWGLAAREECDCQGTHEASCVRLYHAYGIFGLFFVNPVPFYFSLSPALSFPANLVFSASSLQFFLFFSVPPIPFSLLSSTTSFFYYHFLTHPSIVYPFNFLFTFSFTQYRAVLFSLSRFFLYFLTHSSVFIFSLNPLLHRPANSFFLLPNFLFLFEIFSLFILPALSSSFSSSVFFPTI